MTRSAELLESIVDRLSEHADVRAVWLAGSRGRGSNDEHSDIDIWIALDDMRVDDVVVDPLRWINTIAPTIMHMVVPGIAPDGGAFVGSWVPVEDAFVQVDWYIAPYEKATRAADTRMVVGNLPVAPQSETVEVSGDLRGESVQHHLVLALQRVNNAVKYARRGQSWRAADHARRADKDLRVADWLVDHCSEPGYAAGVSTFLPEPVRNDAAGVRTIARTLLDAVGQIAIRAGLSQSFAAPVAAMHVMIDEWADTGFLPPNEYYRTLPRRRVGAGVLVTDPDGHVLVLETTYKQDWEIPRGVCEEGEQPRETARREVREELGLEMDIGPLLVFDHRSEPDPKGDAIMLVYDGGVMADPAGIAVDGSEIARFRFVGPDDLEQFTTSRMATRLRAALQARRQNRLIEINNGEVVPQDTTSP